MAYPTSNPAQDMGDIWTDGDMTPEDVVAYIKDDIVPVDKNSMRNSVGRQISLVQNYVNSSYLGRADIPIQSGYMNDLIATGVHVDYINSDIAYVDGTHNVTASGRFDYSGIYFRDTDEFPLTSDETLITNLTNGQLYLYRSISYTGDGANAYADLDRDSLTFRSSDTGGYVSGSLSATSVKGRNNSYYGPPETYELNTDSLSWTSLNGSNDVDIYADYNLNISCDNDMVLFASGDINITSSTGDIILTAAEWSLDGTTSGAKTILKSLGTNDLRLQTNSADIWVEPSTNADFIVSATGASSDIQLSCFNQFSVINCVSASLYPDGQINLGDSGTTVVRIVSHATVDAPGVSSNGAMYYDTTLHKLMIYANGSWETITSA